MFASKFADQITICRKELYNSMNIQSFAFKSFKFTYKSKTCKCYFLRWKELEEEIIGYSEFHRNDFTETTLSIFNAPLPLAGNELTDFSYLNIDYFHFVKNVTQNVTSTLVIKMYLIYSML